MKLRVSFVQFWQRNLRPVLPDVRDAKGAQAVYDCRRNGFGYGNQPGRRLIPVGGSDSHTHHLRATTFLLSRGRGEAEIRDALVSGRVCVRGPEACSSARTRWPSSAASAGTSG